METFNSGAKRSERKFRYDLIPKVALDRLAKRFTGEVIGPHEGDKWATGGALKYGECNWEKGLPTSDVINHIYDHLSNYVDAFRNGLKRFNGDMNYVLKGMNHHTSKDDDLAGAMWGLVVLMHQEATGMFHDDNFTVFSKESSKVRVDGDESTLSNARDNESFKIPIPINKDVTRSPTITQAQINRMQVKILEVQEENTRLRSNNNKLMEMYEELRLKRTKSNPSPKRKSRR